MKLSEVTRLLSSLKSQYQHKFVIDANTAGVWLELLNQHPVIPYEAAHQAALVWMQDNDWPPSAKDLRDIIAERVVGIPDAATAWTQLQDWLKAGYPGMPDRRPPLPALIADAVREIGGTSMVRNAERPDKVRDQFVRAYDTRRRAQVAASNVTEAWAAVSGEQRKAIA